MWPYTCRFDDLSYLSYVIIKWNIAHGADVLLITSPNLPALPLLDADTSRGKRTTQLDLTASSDRDILATLVKDADVFLQNYRPGGLAKKGFGVQDVITARPGIVYASLNAYGWEGPWRDRRGVRVNLDPPQFCSTDSLLSLIRWYRQPRGSTSQNHSLSLRSPAKNHLLERCRCKP